ncbi:MAG: Asp-tRNA(Asn)/Glu-tRNA(Gln) amidotransferase subunit GatB [Anaerolineae bacterium]|nr:Asp-tRNA(Asn)/Glu-tRNA(Gln) amidotransferase subunit GatB [Anaerolineae bacterium]
MAVSSNPHDPLGDWKARSRLPSLPVRQSSKPSLVIPPKLGYNPAHETRREVTGYEPIIGMEVHAQLLTESKMFCPCRADVFGAAPNTEVWNTRVCPICLGMPGVLPVLNGQVVEHGIRIALALHCEIAETSVFARKNYFYADLPKSYQISQYDQPLARDGWIDVDDPHGPPGATRRIRIRRVHLEEDPARLFHGTEHTLADFNRSGLPLVEIVTEPDLHTPAEARAYLVELRAVLRALDVSTGDMEKGAMRCEPNVSVRPAGSSGWGIRVEVKNLNSFRAVQQALEYEIDRQVRLLDAGGQVRQVTMGWDEVRGRTFEQRSKEESPDYRYFPEPDLPPLYVSPAWVEALRATLPELPAAMRNRFAAQYGLSAVDAGTLAAERDVAGFFETAVATAAGSGVSPSTISNWLLGDLFYLLKEGGVEIGQIGITPGGLAELVTLVEKGAITATSGKAVLAEMVDTGRPAGEIVAERGLAQISDVPSLASIVDDVIAAHPGEVTRYRAGKDTLLSWFMGQVMRATLGQANPQVVADLLRERLDEA